MLEKGALIKMLVNVGLTEKEAKIYLVLLELGDSLPSTISRLSGVKRANTYVLLEKLEQKGLVSHLKNQGKLSFKAQDPHRFLEEQERWNIRLEDSIHALSNALPELRSLYSKFTATPQISLFQGPKGIIQIMEDTLTVSDKIILSWTAVSEAMNTPFQDYHPEYVRKKEENKILIRGLLPYEPEALEFKRKHQKERREIYFVPKDRFPFDNEINIYDDKVSMISHKDQIGVIIQNAAIANTQRSIFNFAFEYAKLLEPSLLDEAEH